MKILICERTKIYREGLRETVKQIEGISFFGETSDGMETVLLLHKISFDLVLLDYDMPGLDSMEILKKIHDINPETKVLVMSSNAQKSLAISAIMQGAAGFVSKNTDFDELLSAVKIVTQGGNYISKTVSQPEVNPIEINNNWQKTHNLTPREFDIMVRMANGKKLNDISTELSLPYQTIQRVKHRVLQKINKKSNTEIKQYCFENNLIYSEQMTGSN